MAETSPTPSSNNAPLPPPPMPSAAASAPVAQRTEPVARKSWPIAVLGVNFLLSLFIAIVVVLAASNIFIMPAMTVQNAQVVSLQKQINELNARLEALQGAPTDEPAAAPAPEPAAAPAPADAPAPAK